MKKGVIKIGTKVTYHTPHKTEIGIVKSFADDRAFLFVVFNCGEVWDHYKQYTAALTPRKNLFLGWLTAEECNNI